MNKLNPSQQAAVDHGDGPLLIDAVPGSGKTAALTRRTAALVERGVPPGRIVLLTFTNKAAEEMRSRIAKIISHEKARRIWAGTFHSICVRLLRSFESDAHRDGRKKDFSIYDESDSSGCIRMAIGELNLDKKKFKDSVYREQISQFKSKGLTWEDVPETEELEVIGKRIWQRYEEILLHNNALDFDDLINVVMRRVEAKDSLGEALRTKWTHVLVDECQDMNDVQARLVKSFASGTRSVTAVGDFFQCIPRGQLVRTSLGDRPIETLSVGDTVLALKDGKLLGVPITRVSRSTKSIAFEFDLGEHGKFQATREHVLFASIEDPRGSFVYLMYRRDMGFRIGVSRTVGYQGKHFVVRTQQESAERLWILAWFEHYSQAAEQEAMWAYEYGIPREPFRSRAGMWCADAVATSRLFKKFGQNGRKLLEDRAIEFEKPNYFAKANGSERIVVNLQIGEKHGHRVEIETSLVEPHVAVSLGLGQTSKGTWRTRRCFPDYVAARACADNLAETLGGYVVEHLACMRGKAARRMLSVGAASVHVGMSVPVVSGDKLLAVPVLDRTEVACDEAFDLEVKDLATFIVNGVVVHNSIYGFRGANPQHVKNFAVDTYHDAKVVQLSDNYRSTKNIVACFNSLVEGAHARTDNEIGEKVSIRGFPDESAEARHVVAGIREQIAKGTRPSECVVLYRVHAISRAIEEELRRHGIRYQVVGGMNFYDRKVVKDAMAYLRLIANPDSDLDFERIINDPPRGLGDKAVDRIRERARAAGKSLAAGMTDALAAGIVTGKAETGLRNFFFMHKQANDILWDGQPAAVSRMANHVLQASGYRAFLETKKKKCEADRNPAKLEKAVQDQYNLEQVVAAVAAYEQRVEKPTLLGFLEEAALMSAQDELKGDKVSLMTAHAAKGLEFDYVWAIGFETDTLPIALAVTLDEVAEEARVAYVMCSRPRKKLSLTYCEERMKYGRTEPTGPSFFLERIPEECSDWPERDEKKRRAALLTQETGIAVTSTGTRLRLV